MWNCEPQGSVDLIRFTGNCRDMDINLESEKHLGGSVAPFFVATRLLTPQSN